MNHPALRYAGPFAIYIVLLAVHSHLPLAEPGAYTIRLALTAAAILLLSGPLVSVRASRPLSSVALGVAVFVIWIAPDLLWPSYRSSPLFENAITGRVASSVPDGERHNVLFLVLRFFGTAAVVPVVEELFWRGWLMRYVINSDFESVPLGAWTPSAFWITAFLFAAEHGPFWDVGLAAGMLYNWQLIRTRKLADCILAHAVTNACLGAYVLLFNQWQYWL